LSHWLTIKMQTCTTILLQVAASLAGILHLMNKMPINWYSKKQATAKMVTYESEFISAWMCINQIVDLHLPLRYLSIPIRDVSYMFRGNKTVIDSSTTCQTTQTTQCLVLPSC
jgi:hypothetical protein